MIGSPDRRVQDNGTHSFHVMTGAKARSFWREVISRGGHDQEGPDRMLGLM